jgi:hypothetical protein
MDTTPKTTEMKTATKKMKSLAGVDKREEGGSGFWNSRTRKQRKNEAIAKPSPLSQD